MDPVRNQLVLATKAFGLYIWPKCIDETVLEAPDIALELFIAKGSLE